MDMSALPVHSSPPLANEEREGLSKNQLSPGVSQEGMYLAGRPSEEVPRIPRRSSAVGRTFPPFELPGSRKRMTVLQSTLAEVRGKSDQIFAPILPISLPAFS